MAPFRIVLTLIGCLLLPPAAGAERVLFDLGTSMYQMPGNWNNVTWDRSSATPPGIYVENAIDANGAPTSVDFNILIGFTLGMNQDAIATDGVYPGSAGRDSFVMRYSPATVQLEDLDPGSIYDVRLFSNTDVYRPIQWTINDESMVSQNPMNNLSDVTVFPGVPADSEGNIVIEAVAAPQSSHGYWNVLDIEKLPPPTSFTWDNPRLGDWNDWTNWAPGGGPPNNPNQTVVFGDSIAADATVVVDSPVTVNRIEFNDATDTYNVAGVGSVSLAATTDPGSPVNPTMAVFQGSHEFQVPVILENDATVDVSSGGTLTFNNTLNLAGHTLAVTGAGTIAIRNDLTLDGGTLDFQQGTIAGNGTVGGDVFNHGGTISPGNSPGATAGQIPEPGTMALLVLSGLLLGWTWARRRRAG